MGDLLPGPDFETHVFSSDDGSSGEEDEDMVQTMGSKHSGDEKPPSRGRSRSCSRQVIPSVSPLRPSRSSSPSQPPFREGKMGAEEEDEATELLPVTNQPNFDSNAGLSSSDSETEELMVVDEEETSQPQKVKSEESVSMQSVRLVDEEGNLFELEVRMGESDFKKWQTYLDGVNSNSDFTDLQKNGANGHCHTLLINGKKFPNLCGCCGLPRKARVCLKTEAEKKALKEEKEVQKQKREEARRVEREIREGNALMAKEANKAKRAESNKRKRDVLEACDGLSAEQVQKAVEMFKADTKPVTKEE